MNYNLDTLDEARESVLETNTDFINGQISSLNNVLNNKIQILPDSSDQSIRDIKTSIETVKEYSSNVVSLLNDIIKQHERYTIFYRIMYFTLVNSIFDSDCIERMIDSKSNNSSIFYNILLSSLSFCIKNNQSNRMEKNNCHYIFSKSYGFKHIKTLHSIDIYDDIVRSFLHHSLEDNKEIVPLIKKTFSGIIYTTETDNRCITNDELKSMSFIDGNKFDNFIEIRNDIVDLYYSVINNLDYIFRHNNTILHKRNNISINFFSDAYSCSVDNYTSSLYTALVSESETYRNVFRQVIDLMLYIESSINSILDKFYEKFNFDITVCKMSNKLDIDGERLGISDRARTFKLPDRRFDLHTELKSRIRYSNKFDGRLETFMFNNCDSVLMDLIRNKDKYIDR